jgi:hypothetical protein
MRGDQIDSRNRTELSLRKRRGLLQHVLLALVVALGPVALSGCAGLVSGNTTSSPPPPSTLVITNVQAPSDTTSTSQIVWTTNVAANSAVDYGTTTSYGSSTPVDSTMVDRLERQPRTERRPHIQDSRFQPLGHNKSCGGWKRGDVDTERGSEHHDDRRQLGELHIFWIAERNLHSCSEPRRFYLYSEQPKYGS